MLDFYNLIIFVMDYGVFFLIFRLMFIYLKVCCFIYFLCMKKLVFLKVVYLVDVNESIFIGLNILCVIVKNGRCNFVSKVNYFLFEICDLEIDDYFKVFF